MGVMKINVGWKPQISRAKLFYHHFLRAKYRPAYALYRLRWHLGPRLHYAGPAPMNLIIEPSSLCNLRCIMCSDRFNPRPRGLMDFDLFTALMDEAAHLGIPSVKLSYAGEPLLHPRFFDMLEYACSKPTDVSFLTNGLLMTPDKAMRAVDCGAAEIIISVDGLSREVYETIRVGASHERLMENIAFLLDYRQRRKTRLPLVRIQFTRQRDNAHEVRDFVRHWKPRVDIVTINEYSKPVHADAEDYSADRRYSDNYQQTFSNRPCAELWQRLAIQWNGDAVPCNGEYVIGNVRGGSIRDIWNNGTLRGLRRKHRAGEIEDLAHCMQCGYRNIAD